MLLRVLDSHSKAGSKRSPANAINTRAPPPVFLLSILDFIALNPPAPPTSPPFVLTPPHILHSS
eukprot:32979-Hanusia_phi.AAC.3